MNSPVFDQSFLFFNIAPYSPGEEERLASAMVDYVKRTGNQYVLYCLTLHPEGCPATAKVDRMLESYRVLKRSLEGTDVRLGILLQAIIGHWPRLDKDEEQWTRTIDIKGNVKRFCVLDKRFQDYILYVATSLARENPCFILGDDDIRSFSPDAECFCPLHVAEFNKRMGTSYTCEEMRALIQSQCAGDREYDAFCQMQLDTVSLIMKLLRQGISQVNPDIPTGACMPGWNFTTANVFAKTIQGNHPAILRVANSNYLETSAKDFSSCILHTQQFAVGMTDIPYLLDESDTWPHHLYSRSSTSMHAKLISSIMCGLKGAKLWFVNAFKNSFPINENYTVVLEKYRGMYPQLTCEVRKTVPMGIRIPCTSRPAHKNYFASYNDIRFTNLGILADKVFGQFGIPFACTFDFNENAVYALSGSEMVDRFTDEELKQLLSRNILVDGLAAAALTKRGFAQFLGVEASNQPVRANVEKDTVNGRRYSMLGSATIRLEPVSTDIEVTSRFYYSPAAGSPDLEELNPSAVFYRNSLGGYVCTVAFNTGYDHETLNDTRKIWLLEVLEKLNGAPIPYVALARQNVATIVRQAADYDLIAVFNINFDEMSEIALAVPALPSDVCLMAPDGTWIPAEFTCENRRLAVKKTLPCYGNAVLRIRY